jgi:hypothetical protein
MNGSDGVRFGDGRQPLAELRLTFSAEDRGAGGWLNEATYTRVRAAGCYARQIDGRDFTRVITFRAIRAAWLLRENGARFGPLIRATAS